MPSSPRRIKALRDEAGVTIIEALVAALIVMAAVFASMTVMEAGQRLTTTSERTEVAVHRAEQRLEEVKALGFAAVELASAPGAATDAADPRAWVSGAPQQLDWDRASSVNALEALAVKPSGSVNTDALAPRLTWNDGRWSGTTDTFVSVVDADLKRITVAVRLDGDRPPRQPVVVATLMSRQAQVKATP